MSLLWGWLGPDGARVADAMGRALRVHADQVEARADLAGLSIGVLEPPGAAPFNAALGTHQLWVAGEPAADCTTLLPSLIDRGVEMLRTLDGEWQLAWWDGAALTIANDRFGSLPLYWAQSAAGVAFAGGVRGILLAPGISAAPDPEALREAVTFGGFRLGDRTNVAAVKKLAPASVLTVRAGHTTVRRYFQWSDIAPQEPRDVPSLIEELHAHWQRAVSTRLAGARRPGQTLSGGLDSRAILAEAAPRVPRWTAVTYGLPGCDDARYAERAAEQVGATWVFEPLYGGDWLAARSARIHETDGLIDLFDLCHLESLPLQARLLDAHLSGYIGDAVSGPTFSDVRTPRDVLAALPYYETAIGLPPAEAEARAAELVAALAGAPPRFALFEHKIAQSTNGWTAAYRPFFRVRRPFTDHAFFDFCQGLPAPVRGPGKIYERWLRARYPSLFAHIPNQKTGLPVLQPTWRWRLEQARRLTKRKLSLGPPRVRNYREDDDRARQVRHRIEDQILRPGSLSCEQFGREVVRKVVTAWFDRGEGAAQVIGALYVYEHYHRELPARLAEAR